MDDNICDKSMDKARSLTLTPDGQDYFPQAIIPAEHNPDHPIIDAKQIKVVEKQLPAYDPLDEDQLCAGERVEDIHEVQPSSMDQSENPKENEQENQSCNLKAEESSCSEKRRQFSLVHSPGSSAFQSLDSVSSELSSHSRHSVTSFLQARQCDAEDILLSLGLGGDSQMSVPERFLVSSSSAKGIDLDVIRRNMDEDDDDIFDNNSASYSSSWSDRNQILEQLPARFITSTSSFGSNTDLSEPEDSEAQKSAVPVIIEPEQNDDSSFDLMRHLRLNRIQNPGREHQHDRILLEPVTEELEVSSVGSGSVRTKISNTQQDSLDSLGDTSVLTKISRKQESEDSFKERLMIQDDLSNSYQEEPYPDSQHLQPTEKDSFIEDGKDGNRGQEYDRVVSIEDSNKDTQTNTVDSESGISSAGESVNLKPPGISKVMPSELTQSYELEDEIATIDENLGRMEDKRPAWKDNNTRARLLKRENSDESSGFEDDTHVKKRSTESLDVPEDDVKTSLLDNQNDFNVNKNNHQSNLLAPFESSTPKTDVQSRRSAFAKRNAWSATTKHRRVAFQDETRDLIPKSRSFDEHSYSAYKLDDSRYSLDIPLAACADSHEDLKAETLIPMNDECISKDRSTPEKTAVNNIKKFLSSLMSIRNKFRKTDPEEEVVPTTRDLPMGVAYTGIPSIVSVPASDSDHETVVSGSPLGRHDPDQAKRKEQSDRGMECIISEGVDQNRFLEELDTFEEDLRKYRATFLAIETTSTTQESYYTKKLLARFSWDIITIRKLRSLIKDELSSMQSCLANRRFYISESPNTPLPPGIVDQMKCLLSMQLSLQNYLLKLAEDVPRFHWKATLSPHLTRSAVNPSGNTTEDMANEIKRSIFQDLNQMFKEQVDSLRKELKDKDDVINELLIKVERIEKQSTNPKH